MADLPHFPARVAAAESLRTIALHELRWADSVLTQLYVYDRFGTLQYRGIAGMACFRTGASERAHQRLLAMRLELRRRMRAAP